MKSLTRQYCTITRNLEDIEARFREKVGTAGPEFAAAAYAEGARLLLKERHAHIAACSQRLAAERRAA